MKSHGMNQAKVPQFSEPPFDYRYNHVQEQDFEVRLESVQISLKNSLRQSLRSKQAIPTFSRVLTSGGTLEHDLRENLTKKY